jgi:hypothetical protein
VRIPDNAACSTCVFAVRLKAPDSERGWWRHEAIMAQHKRYPLECSRSRMEDGNPADRQTMAFSMDASSYRAALLVAPEFACVMYEQGEPTDQWREHEVRR